MPRVLCVALLLGLASCSDAGADVQGSRGAGASGNFQTGESGAGAGNVALAGSTSSGVGSGAGAGSGGAANLAGGQGGLGNAGDSMGGGVSSAGGASAGATSLGGAENAGAGTGGSSTALLTNRAGSIPVGIENVNDSPLKSANYRALLRFVPDATLEIERFYFGFKLRGASCWDEDAGYGAGDGGKLTASLVNIDVTTGLPTTEITSESVNGCVRHNEAKAALGGDPVMVWVNLKAKLSGGTLYGVIVSNAHADPANNFFSFNMPLADTSLAGPHARNEMSAAASGGILGLDPREHVAWSTDAGKSWKYGSDNGQYKSHINARDMPHPATRMPQYGFRLAGGTDVGVQPYYAYSTDCTGCSVTYANARYARSFTQLGGFTASGTDVGTLTLTNSSSGKQASCVPQTGYGFRTCTLPQAVDVAVGESYVVSCTGGVQMMELDNPQRLLFPKVGTPNGEIRSFQSKPANGTNAKDVPNLWAGPLSTNFRAAGDVE